MEESLNWENFDEHLDFESYILLVSELTLTCLLQKLWQYTASGSSMRDSRAPIIELLPDFFFFCFTSPPIICHTCLQSSYIFIGISGSAIFKRSEWGKLPKNYSMPISPPLWLECWPHWARPKVPTTTIEKSHNSNNMVRAKSKSPWWTYKNMQ